MTKPNARRGRPPKSATPTPPAEEAAELAEEAEDDEDLVEATEEPEERARPRPVTLERLQPQPRGPLGNLPLFAGITLNAGNPDESPAAIELWRDGPVREGQLTKLKLDATEDDIRRTYGGGVYTLQVRTANGRLLPEGKRTLELAGEPILQSAGMRTEYARLIANMKGEGLPAPSFPVSASPPVAPVAPALTPPAAVPSGDSGIYALIAAILSSQAQQQQNMIAVITSQTQAREQNQLELFKMLSQREQKTDPLELFREGLKLGTRAFGDDKPDAVSRVIDAAPALLDKVSNVIKTERGPKVPAAPSLTPEQAVAAAYEAIARRDDVLLLEGPLATGALAAVKRLTDLGVSNTDKALDSLFRLVAMVSADELRMAGVLPPVEASAAAAAAPSPPPIEPPAPPRVEGNSAPGLT